MTHFLRAGPDGVAPGAGAAPATLLLAHGAGAGMDSPAMAAFAAALGQAGVATLRFQFAYRDAGRPPPRAETLVDAYREAIAAALAASEGPLLIGGKSMGGRIAAMAAGAALDSRIVGVAVYGYPFRPASKPDQPRLAPLRESRLPVLICQGTRDPFGGPDVVAGYDLPARVEIAWFDDGDHDLKPRRASGHTLSGHLAGAASAVAAFARRLGPQA